MLTLIIIAMALGAKRRMNSITDAATLSLEKAERYGTSGDGYGE